MNLKPSCALVALLAVATPSPSAAASSTAGALEAQVRKAHDAGEFDGVVLVGRGDDVIYRRAIGLADRVTEQAHMPAEVWRWGSLTQQVTAVLVMQEVERGRLRLDGTLAEYLPGFGSAAVARITLSQLLLHTAGLANPDDTPADSKDVPAFYRGEGKSAATKTALRVCVEAPKCAPGDHYEYTLCDDLVLSAILERVNDASYAELIAARIAKPLALHTLGIAHSGSGTAGNVVGFTAEGARAPALDAGRLGAAAALYGSADDLLRFDRALIDDRFVAATTATAMRQGDAKLGYVALGALAHNVTLKHCAAPIALAERQGEIGGIRAVNVIAPAEHAALVAFSNTARTEWGLAWQDRACCTTCSTWPCAHWRRRRTLPNRRAGTCATEAFMRLSVARTRNHLLRHRRVPPMTLPVEAPVAARWKELVLICSKCMKRQDRKALRRELRGQLKAEGRKDVRVVACGCLDLCPKHGVTVARSGELAARPPALHVLDNSDDSAVLHRWLVGD
ncbi:MAG: serine hydrolase domain-containing protein [Dokdonella sp.]